MSLITWVIFGAAVVGKAIGNFSWIVVIYAILSLTLIRMLPVFFVLTGLRTNTEAKLFVGWFGPRGLASIVFAVIVVNANLPNDGIIAITVVCTVIFSIILHGISANSWAEGFGKRWHKLQGDDRES
jgi:NhaP-type Na+/H+ or K+/H+ antiporter